jgi:hypothetical protein
VFEGALDGFALRIEHGFLWCNDDFGLHAKRAFRPRKFNGMLRNNAAPRQRFL